MCSSKSINILTILAQTIGVLVKHTFSFDTIPPIIFYNRIVTMIFFSESWPLEKHCVTFLIPSVPVYQFIFIFMNLKHPHATLFWNIFKLRVLQSISIRRQSMGLQDLQQDFILHKAVETLQERSYLTYFIGHMVLL